MTSIRRSALLLFIAVSLAIIPIAAPASAETDAPAIGCNSDGCSLWFVEYAWPDVVEFNALEFLRVNIDVNKRNAVVVGSIQYFGLLCRIPGPLGSLICPRDSDPELANDETPNIAVDAPGPWRRSAERSERPRPLGAG